MIIDFHTHAFPTKIAHSAMDKLSFASGGLKPQTDGTAKSLKEEMKKDGVDISVVQSIATNPSQQTKVNDFAFELNQDDSLIAFGSVHPDSPNALDELDRIKSMGLKGIKFHPEYQGFYADDAKMKPIYKKISSLGLIVLFHSGHDYGFAPPYHGMPRHILGALSMLDTPVVVAHWGGVGCAEEVLQNLCGREVWFDLSFGYGAMPKQYAQKILDNHSMDKILFGSDMPWHRPSWEMRLIETLSLSNEDKEKIYYKNALDLLQL